MKKNIFIIIIFILAIFIPSSVLSFLAFRAISHEESYIEKQFMTAFSEEIFHTQSLIRSELDKIENELNSIIILSNNKNEKAEIKNWKNRSELVDISFYLSSSMEILWPDANETLTNKELTFLNWNKEFLKGKTATPIFENIATTYKEDIKLNLAELNKMDDFKETRNEEKDNRKNSPDQDNSKKGSGFNYYSNDKNLSRSKTYNDSITEQQATQEIYQNKSLKEKILQKAEEEGKQVTVRNVITNEKEKNKNANKSVYVSELLRFGDIVKDKDHGIIPRILYDKLTLLFWKKTASGRIIGCVINSDTLNKRIMVNILNPINKTRIITVLNENGIPFYTSDQKMRDWKKPFLSNEISELLPHWEIAVYLSNPDLVKSRASFMKFVILLLILIMIIAIITGGILLFNTVFSEMRLAREKTTFAANVTHELKTPLTAIKMFSEMLLGKKIKDENKKNKYLNIMIDETDRLTKLINNVLDFSKLEENKRKYDKNKIDLNKLADKIFQNEKDRIKNNGFKINFNEDKKPLLIYADEEAITQVILNLLSNAEKYSSEKKDIEIKLCRNEKFAVLEIADRGIGIQEKYAKKIFNEFFRVDDTLTSKVRGTGLGLAIAKKIISAHAGEINYISRKSGGSIFRIRIPLTNN